MVRTVFLALFILCTAIEVYAEECKLFSIASLWDYPPYFSHEKDKPKGITKTLMDKLFTDLDIPYLYMPQYNTHDLQSAGLRFGELDMVVLSKAPNEWHAYANYIEPPYAEDAMILATHKGHVQRFRKWSDLMGYRGEVSEPFYYTPRIRRLANDYYAIDRVRHLQTSIKRLARQDIDYILDSRDRLTALLKKQKSHDIYMLSHASQRVPLYLAIRKHAHCSHYEPYFKAKVAQLLKEGYLQQFAYTGHMQPNGTSKEFKEGYISVYGTEDEALAP